MKLLRVLSWIVLLVLGVVAAQWLLVDPGYVLVRFRGSDYTTTVAWLALGVLAGLVVLALAWRLLTWPVHGWRRRRDRRARARLGEGLLALHDGDYARAERLLADAAAEDAEVAAAARLAASQAAVRRGDLAAADGHLHALGADAAASRAIALAELALAAQRPTDALVALDAPAAQPLPPRGLLLRAHALAGVGQAGEAYGLIGSLRQQQALPAARLDALQEQWAAASLRETSDPNVLAARWDALPKPLRCTPAVASAYARRAAAFGWDEAAQQALEQSLDARWDEDLVALYGELPVARRDTRQAHAERWLQAHPASPALLLVLGRLARARGNWPRAQDYLQQALAQGAGRPAWEELGHGWSQAGDESRARLAYANALRAGRDEPVVPIPPAPEHAFAEAAPEPLLRPPPRDRPPRLHS
ncbi:MAG TPA: heme biosynthesis HemY N-terminal domain-containing protein [Xanthomonadaceae bacterium]|nr:heme biosynthesis HemY N-terminal domain-containing protein [Xanthomonadaceae bacterium]